MWQDSEFCDVIICVQALNPNTGCTSALSTDISSWLRYIGRHIHSEIRSIYTKGEETKLDQRRHSTILIGNEIERI